MYVDLEMMELFEELESMIKNASSIPLRPCTIPPVGKSGPLIISSKSSKVQRGLRIL